MNPAEERSESERRIRVAVVMACHNRKALTLRCLRTLAEQNSFGPEGLPIELSVYLLDDGSTDGTAAAAQGVFDPIYIDTGDGTLFWCGGMRRAWLAAARAHPDYYWLVNDDTSMEPGALGELLALVPGPETRAIAVGAITDPTTGIQVYGGWRARGRTLIPATGRVEECETMNANCTLVPRVVYETLGPFHRGYTHAMGDFDYGFEARRRGFRVLQTARAVGSCLPNTIKGTWRDRTLSRRERWRKILSPKGLPPREWLLYTYRNEGLLWPLKFMSPYLKILLGF